MADENATLVLEFGFLPDATGNCAECDEELDHDRQTITMKVGGLPPLKLHQICAWKRATFAFGELFQSPRFEVKR